MAELKNTIVNGILNINGDMIASKIVKRGDAGGILRGNGNVITIGTGTSKFLREDGTWQTVSTTDTGATTVTVTGTGNAVTDASYDASTRQITLKKDSIFALKSEIPTIPEISVTDAGTKPIVSGITADEHTITVSRIGIDDLGLASAYKYKGTKTNLAAIQAVTTKEIGDVYNAEDTGMNYAWNGEIWDALGSIVTVGDGTLTVKTTGTGISASGSFTANQETNSELSITLNSNSEGNRTVGQVVIAKDTGVIATDKLAISHNTSTKATWQYNASTDCIELIW